MRFLGFSSGFCDSCAKLAKKPHQNPLSLKTFTKQNLRKIPCRDFEIKSKKSVDSKFFA